MRIFYLLLAMLSFFSYVAEAQNSSGINKKWYRSDAGDFCLFSFSNVSRDGNQLKNIPRFIYLNSTSHFNKDITQSVGFYTGYSINNIGMIYDENDSVRYKRRVITFGLSAGLKFGNIKEATYFFLEGQLNMAVNYKEKRFVNDKKVDKSNTWFGEQTPLLMPAVSAGFLYNQIGIKAQYFPTNFFNPAYVKDGVQPFKGMEAQILSVSITYDFKRSQKSKTKKTGSRMESAASSEEQLSEHLPH